MRARYRDAALFTTIVLLVPALFIIGWDIGRSMAADGDSEQPAGTDCLLGFPDGEDPEQRTNFTLSQVGINENQWEDHIVEMMPNTINGAWVTLTVTQCQKAERLAGAGATVQQAVEMSIPDPIDVSGPLGGAGINGSQVVPTGYSRIGAPTPTGRLATPGVKVAVLDTGVDARHDDLNVVGGYNCAHDSRGDEGWGVDLHGHGTHVAGTIGAIDNDRFVIGMAPGVAILSIPVLDESGRGSSASVLCGIEKAIELGADVANLSLGGDSIASVCGSFDVSHNGFCNAAHDGLTIVVAAGNDSTDAIHKSPANYEGVVTVSALVDFDGQPGGLGVGLPGCGLGHEDDYMASFSNFGSTVEIMGPGGCILSTVPGNSLGYASGTSMATPHVTGVIAAWMSENPDCWVEPFDAVLDWSSEDEWTEGDGFWDGDHGPDKEPLLRYGAPECPERRT